MSIGSQKDSAIAKAETFIRLQLQKGTWKTGDKLPGSRDISLLAGVGRNNTIKALATLTKGKLLCCQKGVGIFAGMSLPEKETNVPRIGPRWQTIKDQLQKDIFSGRFKPVKTIPSYKELCTLYLAEYRVLKKAIDSLAADGIVRRGKRCFLISHALPTNVSRNIYLFMHEDVQNYILWSHEQEWVNTFIQNLENECHHKNIALIKCRYPFTIKSVNTYNNALGFIFAITNDSDDQSSRSIFSCVKMLEKYHKPIVAVAFSLNLINTEYIKQLNHLCETKAIFLAKMQQNYVAGVQVGTFLVSRGYKKAAFFHMGTQAPGMYKLMEERLQGLTYAFERAGFSDAITFFSPLVFWLPHGQTNLQKGTTRYNQSRTDRFLLDHFQGEIVRLKQMASHKLFQQTSTFASEIRNGMQLYESFIPLFQQALAHNDIRAWICVEDNLTNFGAFEFLKEEKVDIPGKIALIGFQDHIESSYNNISSYRFDFANSIHKILSIIMATEHARKSVCIKGTNYFEIDGMVIDRGSA